jgi:putative transposase
VRDWVQGFVTWYNTEHKHSRIKFVTPGERYDGLDTEVLEKKRNILLAAGAKNRLRWSGDLQDCNAIGP